MGILYNKIILDRKDFLGTFWANRFFGKSLKKVNCALLTELENRKAFTWGSIVPPTRALTLPSATLTALTVELSLSAMYRVFRAGARARPEGCANAAD